MTLLDKKLKEYEDFFHEPYVFYIGFSKSQKDIIKEIEICLKTGEKQSHPTYEADVDY